MQLDFTRFALNILAIPLISAKCKWIFSSTKHLITNSYNYLKADIIKANKCLKSWFGRLEAKAFAKGVDLNIDEQYKEDNNVDDEGEDKDEEDPEGEVVKYTVLDD